MNNRAIFVAATGQNIGKTTICLGIVAGLRKRFSRVGFIKPVGQQYRVIEPGLSADKDTILFKDTFQLADHYRDLSPVILPSGFTRDFLDGQIASRAIQAKIRTAFDHITACHDFTVVEGTGHVGVGSIIGLNNASVAHELGLETIIVTSGGLGSAIDSLALNMAMCERYGVKVRGVILNRVRDEKRSMLLDYIPRALEPYGVPLIGCIPYCSFLSIPTMDDFETLFQTRLLSGEKFRYRHFANVRLVAGSLESYLSDHHPNELIITPASREDIINAVLEHRQGDDVGLLLTSRHPPSADIYDRIANSDVPTLYAPLCSYDAMKEITACTGKINGEDTRRVQKAIELVEAHIDFEALCAREVQVPL